MALKKFKKDKDAVSEIIGTLLMITITVTLFASLAYFIQTLPPPPEATFATFNIAFDPDLSEPLAPGETRLLMITHDGGEPLPTWATNIYLYYEDTTSIISASDSDTPLGEFWDTGETWTKEVETPIELWVVDSDNSNLIWSRTISTAEIKYRPLISDVWADPNLNTTFRESIYVGDTIHLLSRIVDPNMEPTDITVTATTNRASLFNNTITLRDDGTDGDRVAGDQVFTAAIPGRASMLWDGAVITVTATNLHGNSIYRYVLNVRVISETLYRNDTIIIDSNATEGFYGEGGLPGYLGFINFRQGYDIFKGNATTVNLGTSTRLFNPGNETTPADWVYVRIASWDLYSANVENTFILTTQRGATITPPSSQSAFTIIEASAFTIFQYRFNTSGLGGTYPITIRIRDDQGNSFYTHDTITIGTGGVEFGMETYPDSNYTGSRDYFKSTETVYVELPSDVPLPITVQAVTIGDFYGDTQVRGSPPTPPFMNYIAGHGNTRFYIDLRYSNQDPWKLGNQSYSLRVSFTDNLGEQYILTKTIRLEAPRNRQDFVVGTTGIGSGQQNFAHFDYMFWTRNNNFYTTRIMEEMDSTPGARNPLLITASAFGDLDSDGDLDILAGVRETVSNNNYVHYLGYYENRVREIGRFEDRTNVPRDALDLSEIRAIAIGDSTGDQINDFAIGTQNGNVWFYHNTYGVPSYRVNAAALGSINTIVMADVLGGVNNRGDGKAEIIVASANGLYVFQMGATVDTWTVAYTSPGGVDDLAVGDVNGDEILDIIVVRGGAVILFPNSMTGFGGGATSILADATADIHTSPGTRAGTYEWTRDPGIEQVLGEQMAFVEGGAEDSVAGGEIALLGFVEQGDYTSTHSNATIPQILEEYVGLQKFAEGFFSRAGMVDPTEYENTRFAGAYHEITEQDLDASIGYANMHSEVMIWGSREGAIANTYNMDGNVMTLMEENSRHPPMVYRYVNDNPVTAPDIRNGSVENFDDIRSEGSAAVFWEEDVGGDGDTYTQTRYFRGVQNEATVNGLTGFSLSTTQSDEGRLSATTNNANMYVGMRVWKRASDGTETEITSGSPVAVVSRTVNGEGMLSATWTPPATEMDPEDSIVVRVYQATTSPPNALTATFTTGQLNAVQLEENQWTVHYWVRRGAGGSASCWGWGDGTYNSRIEGFRFTTSGEPVHKLDVRLRINLVEGDGFQLTYNMTTAQPEFQLRISNNEGATYSRVILDGIPSGVGEDWLQLGEYETDVVYLQIVDKGNDDSNKSSVGVDYIGVLVYRDPIFYLETEYSLGTPPYLEEYYNITVHARANATGELFLANYSLDGGSTWLEDWDTGCENIDENWCLLYANVSSSSISGQIKVRFTDWGEDNRLNRSLLVDYVNLTGYTPPGKDIDVSYFLYLDQRPVAGDVFTVSVRAYYDDAEIERCLIYARNQNTNSFVYTGYDVHNGDTHEYTVFNLTNLYVSATGEVEIRFKSEFTISGETEGILSIDEIYIRYKDTTILNHTWYVDVGPGNHIIYVEASRTDNAHGDNFTFYWSPNNMDWTPMFTVNSTERIIYSFSSAALDAHSGRVYIQARDTNRDADGWDPAQLSIYLLYINTTRGDSSYTALSHTWSFNIPSSATSLTFHAWARRTDGIIEDNFRFQWSTDNATWREPPMITVSGIVTQQYDYAFGDDFPTGQVYVRVTNTNTSLGKTDLYYLYVDHMYFTVGQGIVEGQVTIAAAAGYLSVGVGDVDGDGVLDISAAKNGVIAVFRNLNPTLSVSNPAAWSAAEMVGDTAVLRMAPGYARQTFVMADMNGNGYADFVASGTVDGSATSYGLYMWMNLGDGTYNRILVKNFFTDVRGGATDPGDITCISVGPTDGWSMM